MKRLLLILLLAAPAAAQDISGFEKVLLPVYTVGPIHGLNGSQFRTRLFVYAPQPTRLFPYFMAGVPAIGILREWMDGGFHQVGSFAHGRLFYFEHEVALTYELETTRTDGVTHVDLLPVVRERDFRSGITRIIGIPVTPRYENLQLAGYRERNLLRIYDADNTGTLQVRVTWRSGSRTLNESEVVDVNQRDHHDPTYPFYAEVALGGCIRGSNPLTPPCVSDRLLVEIEPIGGGRYYAFASSTRNDTNEVTIYTQQ